MNFVLAALLLSVAPSSAHAEINVAESIDWMVRDADLVVRGVVVSVRKHRPPVKTTFALRHGLQEKVVKLSGPKRTRVYTGSFAELTKRSDILKAARRAVLTTLGAGARFFNVDVPFNTAAYRALYGGSSVWMRVPVDLMLQQNARRWIRATDISLRVQGARALGRFRSAANIAELRRLLKDPKFYTQSAPTGAAGPQHRFYGVRRAAYKVLKGWKVKVTKPVIREVVP